MLDASATLCYHVKLIEGWLPKTKHAITNIGENPQEGAFYE